MVVTVARFIHLTPDHCFNNSCVGKQPVAWKEYCVEYFYRRPKQSKGRQIGRHNITEIILIAALKNKKAIMALYLSTGLYIKSPYAKHYNT